MPAVKPRQPAQLPLDLGHRTALGREDFLVAPSNRSAVAWLDRWPDWTSGGLVIHGPAGCGKTHLAHVWQKASDAVLLDAGALAAGDPPDLLGSYKAAIIENTENVGGRADLERGLFHFFNFIRENGGTLLLTALTAPKNWQIDLADLSSRIAILPSVSVGTPDDTLIEAVLVKLCADRQLIVGPEVITYLLARMERSFAAARSLVERLDRAALASGRRITVPFLKKTLGEEGWE